jgi:serine/threonine protein kinase
MRHKLVNNAEEEEVVNIPRIAENGYRLPDPLPTGVILTDSTKRQWILGKSIGCGGFGEIYCAKELPEAQRFNDFNNDSNEVSFNNKTDQKSNNSNEKSLKSQSYNGLPKRSCVQKFNTNKLLLKNKQKMDKLIKDNNYPFVVKVDNINGPLYAEMHFYHRVAKPKQIDNWMLCQRLAFLGMPRYVASGIHIIDHNHCNSSALNSGRRQRYRFLVLDRLGLDLQKVLNKQNNKLNLKSAYTIAMMVIDILAYIHSFGYIHADIKASNLLLGNCLFNILIIFYLNPLFIYEFEISK